MKPDNLSSLFSNWALRNKGLEMVCCQSLQTHLKRVKDFIESRARMSCIMSSFHSICWRKRGKKLWRRNMIYMRTCEMRINDHREKNRTHLNLKIIIGDGETKWAREVCGVGARIATRRQWGATAIRRGATDAERCGGATTEARWRLHGGDCDTRGEASAQGLNEQNDVCFLSTIEHAILYNFGLYGLHWASDMHK